MGMVTITTRILFYRMKAKESGNELMTNSHEHCNDKVEQRGKIDFKYLNEEVEYYLYNGSDFVDVALYTFSVDY